MSLYWISGEQPSAWNMAVIRSLQLRARSVPTLKMPNPEGRSHSKVPLNSIRHLRIVRHALERRCFRALCELTLSLGCKRGRKVQIQGTLQGVLTFIRLFELWIGRSEV